MPEKQVRAQLTQSNYKNIKKLLKFPESASFNDSITELIKKFKESKKK